MQKTTLTGTQDFVLSPLLEARLLEAHFWQPDSKCIAQAKVRWNWCLCVGIELECLSSPVNRAPNMCGGPPAMFWMPAILRSIIDLLFVTSISAPSTSHRTIEHTFKASYRPRKYTSKYFGYVFGRGRLWIRPEGPGEELSLSSMPVCPA